MSINNMKMMATLKHFLVRKTSQGLECRSHFLVTTKQRVRDISITESYSISQELIISIIVFAP